MPDQGIRRLTGWAAAGMVVFSLAQFPLYLVQDSSVGIYDGAAGAAEALRIHDAIFTRVLLDLCLYATGMVFAAGLGHLIRRADPGYGWASSLDLVRLAGVPETRQRARA